MQFDKKIIMAMAAIAVMLSVPFVCSDADADPSYTQDYGEFYSYTLQFLFDGSDAQSIDWDFGDGSEHSSAWNPQHTYAAKGIYYVTQTTTNPIGTTVEIYKVTVKGYPVITFDSRGGSDVSAIQMDSYNTSVQRPSDPQRSGYTFGGWYKDQSLTQIYDWSQPVTESFTLYAKWNQNSAPVVHQVSFDVNGGSSSVSQRSVVSGSELVLPAYTGTRTGYEFAGWSVNNIAYQPGNSVAINSDTVFKAVWRSTTTVTMVTVSFDVNGGSVAVNPINVTAGNPFNFPSYKGVKEGFTFGGWEYNSIVYGPGDTVAFSGNVTLKAVWTQLAADDEGEKTDILSEVTDFLKEPVGIAVIGFILLLSAALILRGRRF